MTRQDETTRLVPLATSGQTVADERADVRGRRVVDSNGDEIGRVDDLLLDERQYKVRFLRVATGGFLGFAQRHVLVPVEAVETVDDEQVRVNRERARVSDAPGYDPDLSYDPAYYASLYGWWGHEPFWGPGSTYPVQPFDR